MQPDAYLIECVGGSHAVHRSLLRVKFPVFPVFPGVFANFDPVFLYFCHECRVLEKKFESKGF